MAIIGVIPGATTVAVRDVIRGALLEIQAIATGEKPTAAETADAIAVLNRMVDSWSLDRVMAYTVQPVTFTLAAGKQTYSIGPGGDVDTVRQVHIERVTLADLQGQEFPVRLIDFEEWSCIPIKSTAGMPFALYSDNQFPSDNLSFFYVPDQAYTVNLYAWQTTARFKSENDLLVLPPGYESAYVYNLALKLTTQYGKQAGIDLQRNAREALMLVRNANRPSPRLSNDLAFLGRGSYGMGGGFLFGSGSGSSSSSSGSSDDMQILTVSTSQTLIPKSKQMLVLGDASLGNVVISLPDPTSAAGTSVAVKKVDGTANTVILSGSIDGASFYTLSSQNQYVIVAAAGNGWQVVGGN